MTTRFDRRRALSAFGTVSLGTLLAACGEDGKSTSVPTTEGATATVEPQTSSSGATAELFDNAGSCRVTTEQTEGPYYFDADAIRSDIREDREGAKLRLAIRVRDASSCEPIPNAVVDIWHCDASGVYSGFDEGEGERFLRGAQVTNKEGVVEFVTIYPGWYPGRTAHIHAKVHLDKQTVLTTQLYFDDAISDRVYANAPYEPGRDQPNTGDGIFDESLTLTMKEEGDGYLGALGFDVERA
jgi:protocatechuate 3,4-dioxygenase beta subunit